MEQKKLNEMTYGFVGLGLMGGSMTKAIRKYILNSKPDVSANSNSSCDSSKMGKILAATRKEEALKKAKNEGVIDDYFLLEEANSMFSLCDFVFICLPPKLTVDFLQKHKDSFKKGSIVTEIAGVKTGIFKAFPHGIENVHFIPGHPMAGNEREGYDYSDSEIFQNRNYIFMPYESTDSEALETFKQAMSAIGFSNLIVTDYKTHDHKIAFTSQLCHVIASALVDCAEDTQVTQFGGGSFEDLTRIALINAPLWTELFCANKAELIAHIEKFEESLDKIKDEIQRNDKEELCETLTEVRERRAIMAKYMKKK